MDTGLRPDITIAIRMDELNKNLLDYYLLPSLDIEDPTVKLSDANGINLDAFRFNTLDNFFALMRRVNVAEVA